MRMLETGEKTIGPENFGKCFPGMNLLSILYHYLMSRKVLQYYKYGLALVLIVLGSSLFGGDKQVPNWVKYPSLRELFPGFPLKLFSEKKEIIFNASKGKANFTGFENVEDVRIENNVLTFKLKSDNAVIGWGNYQDKQDVNNIKDMWTFINQPVLRVKQSGTEQTVWTVKYWSDGCPMRMKNPPKKTVDKGEKWQNLVFPSFRTPLLTYSGSDNSPDGMEFKIRGKKGTQISIANVKLIEPVKSGFFRKDFVLPENDPVWRVIFDISGQSATPAYGAITRLYVNGKLFEWKDPICPWFITSVDMASLLKPGKNSLAVYFSKPANRKDPSPNDMLYLHGTIILKSGKEIAISTDESWKCSDRFQKNWFKKDFDFNGWHNAEIWRKNKSMYFSSCGASSFKMLPAYKGRLLITNPHGKSLFFKESQKIEFDTLSPAGMTDGNPVLEYVVEEVRQNGQYMLIKQGRKGTFAKTGDNMFCKVGLDEKLSPGVYLISMRILKKGETVAEHLREPFIVMRDQMKKISGKTYKEGLDLECEYSIDFTKDDPQFPWIETQEGIKDPRRRPKVSPVGVEIKQPRIVRKDGMTYREGGLYRNTIAYRLPKFKHPGDFYFMELEYPDNAEREIEVAIESLRDGTACYSSSAGAATGGKYYTSGTKQTNQWIHVADEDVNVLYILSEGKKKGLRPAVCSLKAYHIKGKLPSVDNPSDKRLFGIQLERTTESGGFYEGFGGASGYPYHFPRKSPPGQLFALRLKGMFDASDRLAQYLKFAGQNLHCLGCYQYNEYTTIHAVPYQCNTSRLPNDIKVVLANILNSLDIDFYANVQFSLVKNIACPVNNAQVAHGKDTVWSVDENGSQRPFNQLRSHNWMHPRVEKSILDLVDDFGVKFGNLSGFRGINLFAGPVNFIYSGYFYDLQKYISYEDATFSRFEKETKTNLGIDNKAPDRFSKRCAKIQLPAYRSKFIEWRCKKAKELLEKALDTMKRHKRNVEIICPVFLPPRVCKDWVESKVPFKKRLKDFAIDFDLYKNNTGITFGRSLRNWSNYHGALSHRNPYAWIPATEQEVLDVFNNAGNNYVFISQEPHEGRASTAGYKWKQVGKVVKSDWITNTHKVRRHLQPSAFNVRETFIQAMIGSDPSRIVFGFSDRAYPLGFGQELRKFSLVYTRLPKERFSDVLNTSFKTNLVIRKLEKAGKTYFYIINPGYWHISARIKLKSNSRISSLVPWEKFEINKDENGVKNLVMELEPYDLRAFWVSSKKLDFISYRTGDISDRELSHMTGMIREMEKCFQDDKTDKTKSDRLKKAINQTRKALDKKQYAFAWFVLTNWKNWILWHEKPDFDEEYLQRYRRRYKKGRFFYKK